MTQRERAESWLFAAALVAAVFLAYQPAWHGGFLWDDDAHVTKPELRSVQGLYAIWLVPGATQQYYPLLHSAFWFEYKLWGDWTLPYHLVNLALHATAAILVALILRRLAVPGAYLAAAVFALHPVAVESVAWITEMKNTLSAVFYLGAALVYLRFDQERTRSLYNRALALFVLALLSKPVTATLPAALLVVFWWQRGRLSWRRDVRPLIPFFVLGVASGLFAAWVERKLIGAQGGTFDLTLLERCLLAARIVWFYLGKLVWPAELLFFYPRWEIDRTAAWQYVYPAAAVLLVIGLFWLRRRWRGPLAAILFFVGPLFPVPGFFNVYLFRYTFVADHFQYLASLGIIVPFSAAVAMGLKRLNVTPTRSASEGGGSAPRLRFGLVCAWCAYGLCLGLLAVLAGLTFRQCRMYDNTDTLYRTAIARNPACWMAYNNLAMYLNGRKRFDEADQLCRESLRLLSENPQAHNNLGVSLAGRGRFAEAIPHFREALRIGPKAAMPYCNLAWALGAQGCLDEAIVRFQEALSIDPNYAYALRGLDMARAEQGQMLNALARQRELVGSNPKDVALLSRMAWLLATDPNASVRNGAEAVDLARQAVELSPGDDAEKLDILAAAYAEAGRFPEAVATAGKALEIAARQRRQTLADQLRARLALYQVGKPFHQTVSVFATSVRTP